MNPTYKYIASLLFILFFTMAAQSFFLTLELTRINDLLIVISGALFWLGIISINLIFQLEYKAEHSQVGSMFFFSIACILNLIYFRLLAGFTSSTLALVCVFLIALFSLKAKYNRIYFYSFAFSILFIPFVMLVNDRYRLERVMRYMHGTSQETFDFLLVTDKTLPELGIYGQRFFLFFLSNKVGFIVTASIALAVILLWLYLFTVTLKFKTNFLFYKRLALFIILFFIVHSFINILTNIGVFHYSLISNIMPISTNPAFWVFFVALVLCVIRINLKDRVSE